VPVASDHTVSDVFAVLRACEYELAGIGRGLRRVLAGWCLVVPDDSLRA
jgi:hypothetical protein